MDQYPATFEDPDDDFGATQYAEADSPMKKEAAAKRKWVASDAMQKLDGELHQEKTFDIIPKKEMTFGQTDMGDGMQQTQQNWVKNKDVQEKGYLQVRFKEESQGFKEEENY